MTERRVAKPPRWRPLGVRLQIRPEQFLLGLRWALTPRIVILGRVTIDWTLYVHPLPFVVVAFDFRKR